MQRTPEETRHLFDEWAVAYDDEAAMGVGPLLGYEQSLRVFDTLPVCAQQDLVLDVGIGSGAVAARLAQRGALIVGIDPSEQILTRCAAKFPDFRLEQGSFNRWEYPEAAYHAVVSGFAFHETPVSERLKALTNLYYTLKPGGRLALLDIMFLSQAAEDEARRRLGPTWDDSESYGRVEKVDTLLRAAGFRGLHWRQTAPFHWFVTARKPAQ